MGFHSCSTNNHSLLWIDDNSYFSRKALLAYPVRKPNIIHPIYYTRFPMCVRNDSLYITFLLTTHIRRHRPPATQANGATIDSIERWGLCACAESLKSHDRKKKNMEIKVPSNETWKSITDGINSGRKIYFFPFQFSQFIRVFEVSAKIFGPKNVQINLLAIHFIWFAFFKWRAIDKNR